MTGNSRSAVVLQERDRHLLRELAVMRVVDREQAKQVAGFGSTTRVNLRLLYLTRAGLLRRFFLGTIAGGKKSLYALSAKGAALIGEPQRGPWRRQDELIVADFFVQHQLVVNEIYCALKYGAARESFRRWQVFYQPLTPQIGLIPDGYAEIKTASESLAFFLEVDLGTESLRVWKEKVRNYLQYAVSGEFEREFRQRQFRVVVLAHSERRLLSIRKIVASATEKIFWFASLEDLRKNGFFGSVWLRPTGGERQPFVRENT